MDNQVQRPVCHSTVMAIQTVSYEIGYAVQRQEYLQATYHSPREIIINYQLSKRELATKGLQNSYRQDRYPDPEMWL